jgi:hypothetical protein
MIKKAMLLILEGKINPKANPELWEPSFLQVLV